MKTAICFSGQARSLQFTYLNLKQYLIDRIPDCDVFIYVAEDESSYQNMDCLNYLEPKVLKIGKDLYINDIGLIHEQRNGIQSYIQMLNSWKCANQLRLEYEKINNFVYDRVLRTRLDIKLFEPLPHIYDYDIQNYIYIPDFHNWNCVQGNGYNDRFAIGNSENITKYSNMIDYIRQYNSENHRIHAESTLFYHLNKNNIKVKHVNVRFTRVRKYGEEIDNRLRESREKWNEIDR
jgi:hypothetical protein